MIAYTEIRHGKEDGSVLVIEEGGDVKGLPKDVVEQLQEDGIIGDAPSNEEVQDLSDENEQLVGENDSLKAKVAELQKQLEAAKTTK